MCQVCCKIHVKTSTSCQDIDIKPLSAAINGMLDKFIQKQNNIETKLYQLNKDVVEYTTSCHDQKKLTISNYRAKVEQHCNEVENDVNRSANEYINIINQQYQLACQTGKDIKDHLVKNREQINIQMIKTFNSIDAQLDRTIDTLRCPSLSVMRMKIKADAVDKLAGLQVVTEVMAGAPTVPYGQLLSIHRDLVIKATVDLPGLVQQMLVFKGDVWCLLPDSVQVYNAFSNPQFQIKITGLKDATCMAITTEGQVIIATMNGLYLYDEVTGNQLMCLNENPHYSVAAAGNEVVALRGIKTTQQLFNGKKRHHQKTEYGIYADVYSKSMWMVQPAVQRLELSLDDPWLTCAIALGTMYLCSTEEMYKLDYKTGKIHKMTTHGMTSPKICSTDGVYLLIVHSGYKKIQLFNCEAELWEKVYFNGTITTPTSATVDNTGTLYIASGASSFNFKTKLSLVISHPREVTTEMRNVLDIDTDEDDRGLGLTLSINEL